MSREAIIEALLAQVTASPAIFTFTANLTEGSPDLASVSDASGLSQGMPLFGPGVPDLATLATVSPPVMSLPATANETAASVTQGFQTTGRRVIHWSKVAAQPAIFVRHIKERYPTRPTGMLAKVEINTEIWIYCRVPDDANADSSMNPLLDAVELALKPNPVTSVQTLGGAVIHCWIEGDLDIDPGDLDNQAKAVIPIKMLVPH